MPRLTGPLFSLTARNTLGQAVTYSVWRGIQYARQRVIPSNPQTTAQTNHRNIFITLNRMWLRMPTFGRAPWTAAALGQPFTNRNRFLSANLDAMSGQVNMQQLIGSDGPGGAPPPLTAVSASGGAGQLTITLTQPTLPTGWTQVSSDAIAVIDGNPTTPLTPTPQQQQDAVAPFTSVAFVGLATGTYVWSVWNVMTAPDGTTRYSVALRGTQAVA